MVDWCWTGEDTIREEPAVVDVRGDAREHIQPGGRALQRCGTSQEDQGLRLRSLPRPRRRHACSTRPQQYVLSSSLSLQP